MKIDYEALYKIIKKIKPFCMGCYVPTTKNSYGVEPIYCETCYHKLYEQQKPKAMR